MPTVTRRDFLKVGVAGAGALAATGLGFDVAVADSTKVKQNLRIAGAKESHSVVASFPGYCISQDDGFLDLGGRSVGESPMQPSFMNQAHIEWRQLYKFHADRLKTPVAASFQKQPKPNH